MTAFGFLSLYNLRLQVFCLSIFMLFSFYIQLTVSIFRSYEYITLKGSGGNLYMHYQKTESIYLEYQILYNK